MSLITRTYTFTDGTTAYGSQVDSEIANIVNTLNNLDSATASWDIVKAVNGSSTPLIADNSSGTNTVFEARVNGVAKFTVGGTGAITAVNGGTISGAALAMSSQKITGLANATVTGDALHYGQWIGGQTPGSVTNDAATAGNIGEYITASAGGITAPSSGTFGDLANITITAGDWDVSCNVFFNVNGATLTSGAISFGIGTVTGNSSTGLTDGDTDGYIAVSSNQTTVSGAVPVVRKSVTGSTILYLKVKATFSLGTPQFSGRISARRVR